MEQIIIHHADGSETPLFSRKNVSGISKATQKTALLSDDVVTVTVSSAVPLPVDIGDRIKVYGRTYTANQLPEPGKNGLRRYEYDITFEGLQYGLIDAQYKLPPDAYGDTYYSDLYGHLRVLVWNANRVQPNKWRLGSCPAEGTTDYKNLTTSSRNCLQVLQDICSEWNVEFEITPGNGFNTINIKEKAGVTHAFTLRYGRGKGLYSLKRTNVNNAGLTTRLFVYGGQDNLGQNYGHTRLCLPNTDRLTSFLEDAKAIAQYGVKENEKVYDIKPERVGEVTAIGPDEITFSDTTAGDNAMFDLNAKKPDGSTRYLLDGVAAKIKFQTGQLAGYEFDVHKYDHATRTFILNRFTDENGMVFPSATSGAFQISKGDKYIITEIQLPESYITAAENKLAEAAKKDFPAMTQPQVSYKLTLSEDFLIKTFGQEVEAEIFHVGDYINVEDEELGINKAVRIVRIERNLLKRHTYELTLSDTVTKSTTVRVLNEIEDINDVININKLADPTRARRRWMATQELLNMVFDPEGDYYSEKIKPLSIETQMLSVGAKSTQFTLLNVTFQPNYNKDPNALYISGGRLAHYAIEENIRQWVLTTATYTNLKPATAYYIYARCSTTAGNGTIILSESAITVEQEAGYYNFLVGVLNSVVTDAGGKNPGRLVSLTYGSSTINGRFLRTGRIESSGGGKCYFDLDNDEIGGVIRFVGSDGNYYDIADVQEKTDELKDYINNTLPGVLGELQAQLDGVIKQWFYQSDPSDTTEPTKDWIAAGTKEQDNHLSDLYYNTETGKVWQYIKTTEASGTGKPRDVYKWQELEDTELAQALALAQDALDAANDKAKIFVSTPYTPYHVGDLWLRSWTDSTGVARKDLYRCVTARASGFNVNDWAEATFYDNTQVTIDRGIITAGTVQLANKNSQSIVAGITGGENEAANETEAQKVRIWAGASKANRFTAPFRVLQDGSFVATKGTITGTINAKSGTIGNKLLVSGEGISYGDVSTWDYSTGEKMLLSPQAIRIQTQDTTVGNSNNHPFGRVALGKGANSQSSYDFGTIAHIYKYDVLNSYSSALQPAVLIESYTKQGPGVALKTNGSIVARGGIVEMGNYIATKSSVISVINLYPFNGSIFIINNKTANKPAYLPSVQTLRYTFGINICQAFTFRMVVISMRGNSNFILQKPTDATLYNGNSAIEKLTIGGNTQYELLFITDGSTAYWKIKNIS